MSVYYAVNRSDEYLEHYGVKGMKWRRRKAKKTSSSVSRASSSISNPSSSTKTSTATKNVSQAKNLLKTLPKNYTDEDIVNLWDKMSDGYDAVQVELAIGTAIINNGNKKLKELEAKYAAAKDDKTADAIDAEMMEVREEIEHWKKTNKEILRTGEAQW